MYVTIRMGMFPFFSLEESLNNRPIGPHCLHEKHILAMNKFEQSYEYTAVG